MPLALLRQKLAQPAASYLVHDLRGATVAPLEAFYRHRGTPCLLEVDAADCRWIGASGLSYARTSSHPYVRTLRDHHEGKVSRYEDSFLRTYWQAWQPENLAEMLGLDSRRAAPLLRAAPPLHGVMPWSGHDRIDYLRARRWSERDDYARLLADGGAPARSCGPKPTWFGRKRFAHLIKLYERIRVSGYRRHAPPTEPYRRQHIVVDCLVKGDAWRFVVADGQHRAATLSALGHDKLPVILFSLHDRGCGIVRRSDASFWPLVRAGLFSEAQAVELFDRIFEGVPPSAVAALAPR